MNDCPIAQSPNFDSKYDNLRRNQVVLSADRDRCPYYVAHWTGMTGQNDWMIVDRTR